jgi:hypothetical protein
MTIHDYPAAAVPVPWPAALQWTRRELRRYLKAASDPTVRTLPTRCPPWNVAGLTAHLAAIFRRFADLLDRARAGDLYPPFPPDHLPEENLLAVPPQRRTARFDLRRDQVRPGGMHVLRVVPSPDVTTQNLLR